MGKGKLVISLDFELYWGIRDVVQLQNYQEHLLGVRKVIPGLLDIFERYRINATFATVGFLFFRNKKELLENIPSCKPGYTDSNFSPYNNIESFIGDNEEQDPFHYGYQLIEQIQNAGQEIGSHTFSHYYCLEKGQTREQFKADLAAAIDIASKRGITLKSIVFPRNQFNKDYLNVCREMGFTSYRGNEKSNLFSAKTQSNDSFYRRPFRLLDTYINLSGHNVYHPEELTQNGLVNIPASRFLRPYSTRLALLEKTRLRRICRSMDFAAQNGLVYHLWWHPHNFGINQDENFAFLEKILIHYTHLHEKYSFESAGMLQLANELSSKKRKSE